MEKRLNKNAIKSWIISRTLGSGIFIAVIFGVIYVLKHFFQFDFINYEKYINIIMTCISAYLLIYSYVYPFIEYHEWKYLVEEDKVEFSEGILIKNRTIIPIIKIEHINIKISPVNSRLGLANIEIFTAGGSHSIPNIELDIANEIGDYLNNKIKEKVKESNGTK